MKKYCSLFVLLLGLSVVTAEAKTKFVVADSRGEVGYTFNMRITENTGMMHKSMKDVRSPVILPNYAFPGRGPYTVRVLRGGKEIGSISGVSKGREYVIRVR